VKTSKRKEIFANLYQCCILGPVQGTGTSNFLCQHTCWIRACRHRSSWCAGELEQLDLLAPATPAACYFPDDLDQRTEAVTVTLSHIYIIPILFCSLLYPTCNICVYPQNIELDSVHLCDRSSVISPRQPWGVYTFFWTSTMLSLYHSLGNLITFSLFSWTLPLLFFFMLDSPLHFMWKMTATNDLPLLDLLQAPSWHQCAKSVDNTNTPPTVHSSNMLLPSVLSSSCLQPPTPTMTTKIDIPALSGMLDALTVVAWLATCEDTFKA